MKIFVDTNIFLDLILKREHFEKALLIFNAIEKRIETMKNGDLKLPTDTSKRDEEEKEDEKEW